MNVTDVQIVTAFGKMIGILKWADSVCGNEDVTLAETQSLIGRSMNHMEIEFAKFPAEWFTPQQPEPTAQQIQTQFDAYKEFTPGQVTEKNIYGFGYKLPARVQMEYFYVNADDAKQQIEKPSAEAMEEYYSSNIAQFRSSHPKDPNDPKGEQITETRSFAEVSSEIYNALEQQRAEKLIQLIFKDAKDILDAGMLSMDMEKATNDQLHQAAIDYPTVAAKLTEKYKIVIHTGKTGLLSPADFAKDNGLRALRLTHSGTQTALAEAVFAIDTKDAATSKKLGVYLPRMWENIGPLTGGFYSEKTFTFTPIAAICRVIDIQKSDVPATSDVTYSIAGILSDSTEEKVFDLKKNIVEDLKTIQAMETARTRAEEFKSMIAKTDWNKALDKYNAAYAPKDPNSVPEKAFRKLAVTTLKSQTVIPENEITQLHDLIQDNPMAAEYLQTRITTNTLNRKFAELSAEKKPSDAAPYLVEFAPGAAYYLVKNIIPQAAAMEKYLQNKPYAALQAAQGSASVLAFTHFDPQNIHKRLNYVAKKQPVTKVPSEE